MFFHIMEIIEICNSGYVWMEPRSELIWGVCDECEDKQGASGDA